ncbi:MAG TPA: helix-turn-helix transcriptional regulator [Kiritimatiellia bacterium]|nr:helix-turn-helix transcriptional regulator [Kiritimatiellia bacterium]HSA19375.1 helix-turn-helix transcriptional regulator [Kiritimatiellia bacterium]
MSVYSPAYQDFIQRLRLARKQARLTQVEASRRLGKPHSFISKCELGERRVDLIEALRLAKLYKKPLSFFTRRLSV